MSRNKKLLDAIRNNPKDVRYEDALRAADLIGFTSTGGSGSHCTRSRQGELVQLNFQRIANGRAKPYQVRQLIEMLDKYESEIDGE